jgi:hypothetical protein
VAKRKNRAAQNLARKRWAKTTLAERRAFGRKISAAASAARTAAAKLRREQAAETEVA